MAIDDRANESTSLEQAPNERTGEVGSVAKALEILDLLSLHPEGIGVSQIAAQLGISPATAHNALTTLAKRGYASQAGDRGKYRLGPHLFLLAQRMVSELNLRQVALPILTEMSEQLGDTMVLSVVRQQHVWYLVRVHGDNRLVVQFGRESNPYFHCHSQGKVLLSGMTTDRARAILQHTGLPRQTPNTITDLEQLMSELSRVRQEGIAYNHEEGTSGVVGLSAPVRDFTGRVVAAVCLAAPSTRVSSERLEELTPIIKDTARRVSEQLGYRPPF